MTAHRALNIALACVIAATMATAHLLDGPSELDAARATEASKQDTLHAATAEKRHAKAKALMDNQQQLASAQGAKP